MSQEGFDRLKNKCINSGLCVECGACEVVCPSEAVKLKEYSWGRNPELVGPCVQESCYLCYKVCPANDAPLTEIEEKFFGRKRKNSMPEKEVGVIKKVYTGYAMDKNVHKASASGGVISGMLIYALEEGVIDGAVLADFDPERPWMAKAAVAVTKEDVIRCANSKYQPHPQLLGLRDAAEMGLKKIAVTSTPCHAVGIRKIMMYDEFKDIGGRIKLVISNICAAHWSVHGTEWLIREQMGLRLEDVAGLKYRAKPFPGIFEITLKDGNIKRAPFVHGFLGQLGRFTPEECRVCLEKIGFTADVVCGDTWHHPVLSPHVLDKYSREEMEKDERIRKAKAGVTAVLTRSGIGQEIFEGAREKGCIRIYPDSKADGRTFLTDIHREGKPVYNGPVVEARKRRGMPVRNDY